MFQEQLKKQQPVAYQTLYHAMHDDHLAHAYMFSGPAGTPKKETAILFAQSLLCGKQTYACEECSICKRVAKNEYSDVIYIDGKDTSIKKDEILKLQQNFNKTGLEQAGKKVYIIDHVENATIEALNSLLKFLEEPTNDMIAVLISESIDRVLPTIVSRCQIIPFVPMRSEDCYRICKEEMDDLEAYVLSQYIHNKEAILQAQESDAFQHAFYVWKQWLEHLDTSFDDILLFLQLEGFPPKNQNKEALLYVLDFLILIYKDSMRQTLMCDDPWYQKQLKKLKNKPNTIAYIDLLMKARDQAMRNVNISLLLEQLLYDMKEV